MTTQTTPIMNIALTNLHKYVAGQLDFTWLALPATSEEIAAAYDKIQVSHDNKIYYSCEGPMEEAFISDYECDFYNIGEYENIDSLNEMAEEIADLDEDQQEIVKALINDCYSLEEALKVAPECIYWHDCDNMTDVARAMIEEYGDLDRIPEDLRDYFDYEAYGNNLETAGHFIATDNGYIEVIE